MVANLQKVGLILERSHHEVAALASRRSTTASTLCSTQAMT